MTICTNLGYYILSESKVITARLSHKKRKNNLMETYIQAKSLVKNEQFQEQRKKASHSLDISLIDEPIRDLVTGINNCPNCFTLQSCYGHFLFQGQSDPNSLERLPDHADIESVDYRIAYLALCVDNNRAGKDLLSLLRSVVTIDEDNIQFGSAHWFWKRQPNTFVLQVEPNEFKEKDRALLSYEQALEVQQVRDLFFEQIRSLLPF